MLKVSVSFQAQQIPGRGGVVLMGKRHVPPNLSLYSVTQHNLMGWWEGGRQGPCLASQPKDRLPESLLRSMDGAGEGREPGSQQPSQALSPSASTFVHRLRDRHRGADSRWHLG